MKKRVGIIGCGFISYDHISSWISNGCDVVAVCDVDADRMDKRANEFGIKNKYTDYKEMIANEKLDIIDIATPVKTHRELVSYCCEKAPNLLVEKPFADNIEDGRFLVRLIKKNHCRVMICQSYRWHPWYEEIKKILDQGLIGKPYYANIMQRINFDIPGPNGGIPLIEDQPFYEKVEKLMLLEQGCHYLDMFRHLFGEPQYVQGIVDKISPHVNGDDLAIITIKFPDTLAVLEDLWCVNGQDKTSVTFIQGQKGSIYFDGTDGSAPHRTEETGALKVVLMDGRVEEFPMDAKNYYNKCFAKLQKHFLNCIENDLEPITSAEDNLKTLMIAFKAYESTKCKHAMYFGE
jgi:predicted dehydrogenase